MRIFGTSRVTQETMIIGLGFQNIQFTLVIMGMVINSDFQKSVIIYTN